MGDYIGKFYLDNEKDIAVSIFKDNTGVYYEIHTPNHHTGNLIINLAKNDKEQKEKVEEDLVGFA